MRQRTWETATAFNYVFYSKDELKALHFKSHVGLVSLSHCFNERTLIPVCAFFVKSSTLDFNVRFCFVFLWVFFSPNIANPT